MSPLEKDVVRLAKAGMPPREIAERLRKNPNTVHSILWRKRREGMHIPKVTTTGRPSGERRVIKFDLGPADFEGLREESHKRGLTPKELAAQLTQVVIRENIVSAVLDDDGERHE